MYQGTARSLSQDLITGKKLYCEGGIQIILDEDPDNSGLYPLHDEKETKKTRVNSFHQRNTDFNFFCIQKDRLGHITSSVTLTERCSYSAVFTDDGTGHMD
jgi:hypothetical protein